MKTVAVLYGGISKERDVSLQSGAGVIEALERLGYDVRGIDFQSIDFVEELEGVDGIFIALHGVYGEDGRIQGLLDILGIPYVGSGVMASALAMNKALSKIIFANAGIRVAKDYLAKQGTPTSEILEYVEHNLSYPLVVKPNLEGSSIGLSYVSSPEELASVLKTTFADYEELLIEEWIVGKEVTVAVIESGDSPQALPVIEIIPNLSSYYDYASKYAAGGSDHIVPARIPEAQGDLLQDWALRAFKVLGCRSVARVDFIIPEDGTDPVILEINTLPGMTKTSLVPDAARAIGLSYDELVRHLVETAINRTK